MAHNQDGNGGNSFKLPASNDVEEGRRSAQRGGQGTRNRRPRAPSTIQERPPTMTPPAWPPDLKLVIGSGRSWRILLLLTLPPRGSLLRPGDEIAGAGRRPVAKRKRWTLPRLPCWAPFLARLQRSARRTHTRCPGTPSPAAASRLPANSPVRRLHGRPVQRTWLQTQEKGDPGSGADSAGALIAARQASDERPAAVDLSLPFACKNKSYTAVSTSPAMAPPCSVEHVGDGVLRRWLGTVAVSTSTKTHREGLERL